MRDRRTQALLAEAGIAARLVPDPAVMVAALFGDRIRARADTIAPLQGAWPGGYLAVQFSADFGDDATLALIAARLDEVCAAQRCGVVFFRAGAAPWHDDLALLHRVAARMRSGRARVFESADLWELCALIAHGRAFCGSSLHGRIVALAFGMPRVNLRRPGATPGKQAAFAASWDDGMPVDVDPGGIDSAIGRALSADAGRLRETADRLARRYRDDFETICRDLP